MPPEVVTVPSAENMKSLANAYVHVIDINTTFYISSSHQITVIYAGPIYVRDYDYVNNPLHLREQTVYDFKNNRAIHYDPYGAYRVSVLKEVL